MSKLQGRPKARAALIVGALAVSSAFAYLAVRGVHPSAVWEALQKSNLWWLLPAFAANAAADGLRACRWRFLFAHERRPPFRPVLEAMLIGQFFNNVLPARAGEAARVVALNQSAGTSRAETAGTVVLERAYDVLCVLAILFVLLPWLPDVSWLRAAAVLAIGLSAGMILAVVLLVLFRRRPFPARTRLPFLATERTERAALNLVHGLAALRRPRLVVAALAWTTTSWVAIGVSSWLVMRSFDLDLSPVAGMLVMIANALGMILPSSPAAIGVFEAAVLVGLNPYSVAKPEALSYALVLHALNFFPYIAAGLIILGVRVRRSSSPRLSEAA